MKSAADAKIAGVIGSAIRLSRRMSVHAICTSAR